MKSINKANVLKVSSHMINGDSNMYIRYIKRFIDVCLSFLTMVILSPLFALLILVGAVAMKGNPFFFQKRVGFNENIFCLIKFRTMSNAKDKDGNLLPNEVRLNRYGKVLRATSLDELPELINIFKGDMAIVGPRPLLPEYLPYYTEEEHHRHDIRPGLTGLAQANSRNAIKNWEERFAHDLEYIDNCSALLDIKIMLMTIKKVFKRSGIMSGGTQEVVGRLDEIREKAQTSEL